MLYADTGERERNKEKVLFFIFRFCRISEVSVLAYFIGGGIYTVQHLFYLFNKLDYYIIF
jgi:hypothetical protein